MRALPSFSSYYHTLHEGVDDPGILKCVSRSLAPTLGYTALAPMAPSAWDGWLEDWYGAAGRDKAFYWFRPEKAPASFRQMVQRRETRLRRAQERT